MKVTLLSPTLVPEWRKTTDGRYIPTAIVFWQRGRGHNHQARGQAKDKK